MRIFVPQPIPPVAAARLEELGEVTTYPHTDRRIPYDELLEAVRTRTSSTRWARSRTTRV